MFPITRMTKSSFHKEFQTRVCERRLWASNNSKVDAMIKSDSVRNAPVLSMDVSNDVG